MVKYEAVKCKPRGPSLTEAPVNGQLLKLCFCGREGQPIAIRKHFKGFWHESLLKWDCRSKGPESLIILLWFLPHSKYTVPSKKYDTCNFVVYFSKGSPNDLSFKPHKAWTRCPGIRTRVAVVCMSRLAGHSFFKMHQKVSLEEAEVRAKPSSVLVHSRQACPGCPTAVKAVLHAHAAQAAHLGQIWIPSLSLPLSYAWDMLTLP